MAMPPVKQLSCARSQPRVRVPHLLVAHASPERSPDYDKAQLAFPQQDVSRHPVSAYQSMAETVARFALYAGSTFPHLLLAIFSWLTAEFLAGCAAYVQAMYPPVAIAEERVGPGERAPTMGSRRKVPPR
jgi:hypothetical protein